jgi:hypothetical protein
MDGESLSIIVIIAPCLLDKQKHLPPLMECFRQTEVLPSKLAKAKKVPHGEKSRDRIVRRCASSILFRHIHSLFSLPQIRTVLSLPQLANSSRVGCQATCHTFSVCPRNVSKR